MGKIKRWLHGDRKPTADEAIVLQRWAEELAEHYKMNAEWIEDVLTATIPLDSIWSSDADRAGDGKELLRRFHPNLLQALETLTPEDVEEIFTNKDGDISAERLDLLEWREQDFKSIFRSPLPLQSYEELEDNSPPGSILSRFADYLSSERADFIRHGSFFKRFTESEWLCHTFGGPAPELLAIDKETITDPDVVEPPVLSSVNLVLLNSVPPKGARISAEHFQASIDGLFPSPKKSGTFPVEIGADGLEVRPMVDYEKQIKSTPLGRLLWRNAENHREGFSSSLRFYFPSDDQDIEEKLHNLKKHEPFKRKEIELRESIATFISKSFALFTNAITKRSSNDSAAVEQQFLDGLWTLVANNFTPEQIDVLTGKSLQYFELPLELPKGTSWNYSSPCLEIFVRLSLVAQDIFNQVMVEVRANLTPLLEETLIDSADDSDNSLAQSFHQTLHFRMPDCSYYQALYLLRERGIDLNKTITNYRIGLDNWFEKRAKAKDRILSTRAASERQYKQLNESLEVLRAVEMLAGRKGFLVNADEAISEAHGRKRFYGFMEEGYTAYHPKKKDRHILVFRTPEQRATIRLMYEAIEDPVLKGAVSEEMIVDTIYVDAAEKEHQRKRLFAGDWRIDTAVFDRSEAWKERFITRVEKIDREDTLYYRLDFDYENKEAKPKRRPKGERKKVLEKARKEKREAKKAAQITEGTPQPKKNTPRVSAKADKKGSKPPAKRPR